MWGLASRAMRSFQLVLRRKGLCPDVQFRKNSGAEGEASEPEKSGRQPWQEGHKGQAEVQASAVRGVVAVPRAPACHSPRPPARSFPGRKLMHVSVSVSEESSEHCASQNPTNGPGEPPPSCCPPDSSRA